MGKEGRREPKELKQLQTMLRWNQRLLDQMHNNHLPMDYHPIHNFQMRIQQ